MASKRNIGHELNRIHREMLDYLTKRSYKAEAEELEQLLRQVKKAASDFDRVTNSVAGNAIKNEFHALVEQAFAVQSPYHSKMQARTLFRREHGSYKGRTVAEADDIFEEDLAAVLTALEQMGTQGKTSVTMQSFLFGGKSASMQSTLDLTQETKNWYKEIMTGIAKKEDVRIKTQLKETTGKIDINGENITANYGYNFPVSLQRLAVLMKDATISAKNYTSRKGASGDTKSLAEIGIHLGNTVLYKAITGVLSELNYDYGTQMSILYQGLNRIKKQSDGTTAQHFSHMRFMYELRGSGLVTDQGVMLPVKYLIYNDPHSDNIFVRDTASIILEAFQNSGKNLNLFGSVGMSAASIAE